MIIIGYQGIGKSTLAGRDNNYIDLESGNFWVDGKRPNDWYLYYCNVADHLSRQGFNVFVSSHQVVRDRLKEISKEKLLVVVPSLDLKEQWCEKLKVRYEATKSDKDFKAWKNAEDRYVENIQEILSSDIPSVILSTINYNLKDVLESY